MLFKQLNRKTLRLCVALPAFFLGSFASQAAKPTQDPVMALTETHLVQAADNIRQLYDNNFTYLSRSAQNHYAVRMFRLTGEPHYGQQAVNEVFQIQDRLDFYLEHLADSTFRRRESQRMIDNLPQTRRGKLRRRALSKTTDERFALYLLYQLAKLNEYGLTHRGDQQFKSYLSSLPLKALLLSDQFIEAYAAQVANYVHWLAQLGIADHRLALNEAFLRVYPDSEDGALSKRQFKNKIYGLTHIVLAASGYYQQPVSTQTYGWITEYFTNNLSRIIRQTKADIQAEVGLSYLLLGQHSHPSLKQLKQVVAGQINPDKQMILSVRGNDDLSLGEHRNVLAFALLHWPQNLTKGPDLLSNENWHKQLPLVYRP